MTPTRSQRAEDHPGDRHIVLGTNDGAAGPSSFAQALEALAEGGGDRRQGLDQGDEAGGGDRAGADVAHVGEADLVEVHLADRDRPGRERGGHGVAEDRDQRYEDQLRQDAAGHQHAGDLGTDDVADAQVLRRDVAVDRRPREGGVPGGREDRRRLPQPEDLHRDLVERRDPEAVEHQLGERAALLAGDQHVGAGGALRVGQHAVLLDDQRPPQRDHEQHAEDAADQREGEDVEVVEVRLAVREEDERRDGESDAGGDRLAGRADRLHDVVLEDGRLADVLEDADRQHRDRDRGRDGQAGGERQVDRRRAEDQPEDRSQKDRLEGELRHHRRRRNVGLELLVLRLGLGHGGRSPGNERGLRSGRDRTLKPPAGASRIGPGEAVGAARREFRDSRGSGLLGRGARLEFVPAPQ